MSLETFLQGGPGQDGSRKSTKHKKIKQCKKNKKQKQMAIRQKINQEQRQLKE